MPKEGVPVSHFPGADKLTEDVEAEKEEPLTESQRMERSQVFTLTLCAILAGWLYFHFIVQRKSLDINSLNTSLLFLTFMLHRNVHRFTQALQKAILSAWPVIVIYHLYAGVAGLIQFTNVGESLAVVVAYISMHLLFSLMMVI